MPLNSIFFLLREKPCPLGKSSDEAVFRALGGNGELRKLFKSLETVKKFDFKSAALGAFDFGNAEKVHFLKLFSCRRVLAEDEAERICNAAEGKPSVACCRLVAARSVCLGECCYLVCNILAAEQLCRRCLRIYAVACFLCGITSVGRKGVVETKQLLFFA